MKKDKFNLTVEFPTGVENKKDGSTVYTMKTSTNAMGYIKSDMMHKGFKAEEAETMLDTYFMLKLAKMCGLPAAYRMTIKIK